MNSEELIRSGSLEAYVLGQASSEEAALVERVRASDRAVKAELEAIELALEQHALQAAVAPAPGVRVLIMDRIASEPKGIPVIPLDKPLAQGTNWLAAASVAALVLSAAVNWLQYTELREVRGELARLENDRSVLASELDVQRTSFQQSQEQLAVVLDPHADLIVLNGMGSAPESKARIYWDRTASVVHFDALNMPAPPEGKQYQLWALVDGQPVDAGMISKDDHVKGLLRMKDVPKAQAFAVTIEKEGGVTSPTIEAMVLLGKVG